MLCVDNIELLFLSGRVGRNNGMQEWDKGIVILWSYDGCFEMFGEWFSIWKREIEIINNLIGMK